MLWPSKFICWKKLNYISGGRVGPDSERSTTMKTDALTNPIVKTAIEALQNGDQKSWSALFEPNAELYDDGSPRSLKEFTRDALGHERFTSIDRVENNGLELTGAFHSEQWGDFQTYFKVQLSPAGKINRLDIGQAT
jgi:hypothetical protein